MRKDHLIWFAIGALAYFGFLRFRGVVAGTPWKPMGVAAAA